MDGVRQARGARRVAAERMDRARRVTRFLKQFTTARFLRRLALFGRARGQFPSELLQGGPELTDDRKLSVGRTRDDRNIIALGDGVIQFGRASRAELHAALDDFHPRRNVRRAAAYDLRPGHCWCPQSGHRLAANGSRRPAEIARGKSVAVPAQVIRQPPYYLKPAGAVRTLEPTRRHFADPPAETVTLHQKLDAVAKAMLRLDWNLGRGAVRKKAEAVAGVVRRQARQMIKREIRCTDEDSLQPWAADHSSSGHEAAGANNITALGGLSHHQVQYGSVVVIIGWIHDYERRIARGKSG